MITWQITNTNSNTSTGYIKSANWVCTKTEDDLSTSVTGDVCFTEPDEADPESYGLPYADVTEENAIAWTKEKLGADSVANIELTAGRNLEAMKTPKQKDGLPWVVPTPAEPAAEESSEGESEE